MSGQDNFDVFGALSGIVPDALEGYWPLIILLCGILLFILLAAAITAAISGREVELIPDDEEMYTDDI